MEPGAANHPELAQSGSKNHPELALVLEEKKKGTAIGPPLSVILVIEDDSGSTKSKL